MRKVLRLLVASIVLLLIAGVLSIANVRTKKVPVTEGFVYGPPTAQAASTTKGMFIVKYYGYPTTYKEQHLFQPTGDVFSESSYDFQPFDWFYVVSNMMFWSALFVAVLSPVTIFWRPKKPTSKLGKNDQAIEPPAPNPVEPNENTRN